MHSTLCWVPVAWEALHCAFVINGNTRTTEETRKYKSAWMYILSIKQIWELPQISYLLESQVEILEKLNAYTL